MAVFIVSYDLRKPGQDYSKLYTRLAEWKAVRGLESVWFINWDTTAAKLRDDLLGYLDSNDRLFVGALSGEAAWNNMQGNAGATFKSWFPG